MLRIGEDYSPHMSNIIIAQVMTLNQQTSIFTLKIISKYWYFYYLSYHLSIIKCNFQKD